MPTINYSLGSPTIKTRATSVHPVFAVARQNVCNEISQLAFEAFILPRDFAEYNEIANVISSRPS